MFFDILGVSSAKNGVLEFQDSQGYNNIQGQTYPRLVIPWELIIGTEKFSFLRMVYFRDTS
jgi:hypothetical protein